MAQLPKNQNQIYNHFHFNPYSFTILSFVLGLESEFTLEISFKLLLSVSVVLLAVFPL